MHIYTNTYHLISASTLKTPHSGDHHHFRGKKKGFLLVEVRAPSSGDPPRERKDSRGREPGRGGGGSLAEVEEGAWQRWRSLAEVEEGVWQRWRSLAEVDQSCPLFPDFIHP